MRFINRTEPIIFKGEELTPLETFCNETQSNLPANYWRLIYSGEFTEGIDFKSLRNEELKEFKLFARTNYDLDTRFINKLLMLTKIGYEKLKKYDEISRCRCQ